MHHHHHHHIVMLSVPFYCQAALRYTTTAAGRGTDV
eukprot:COSAG06_NODE_3342_length_5481_cov_2.258826_4_plen_36_part_00